MLYLCKLSLSFHPPLPLFVASYLLVTNRKATPHSSRWALNKSLRYLRIIRRRVQWEIRDHDYSLIDIRILRTSTVYIHAGIMATELTPTTCKLCSQHFSDPCMLPCLHSFCYQCLLKHFDANKSEFSCPACEEAFELNGRLASLPQDLHSRYMAEVSECEEKARNQSSVNCDRCIVSSESVAVKFCCNC